MKVVDFYFNKENPLQVGMNIFCYSVQKFTKQGTLVYVYKLLNYITRMITWKVRTHDYPNGFLVVVLLVMIRMFDTFEFIMMLTD